MKNYRQLSPDGNDNGSLPPVKPDPVPPVSEQNDGETSNPPNKDEDDKED